MHGFKKISRGIALVTDAVSLALVTTECAANWNKIVTFMNLCMCSLARITPGTALDVTFSAPTLCLHLAVAELELKEVMWTCLTLQWLSLSCVCACKLSAFVLIKGIAHLCWRC